MSNRESDGAKERGRTSHDKVSPNSAIAWIPAMERAAERFEDIHVPDSKFIEVEAEPAINWIDGDGEGFNFDEIAAAAESMYPVFVRTDITSAKHQGLAGIRARDRDELQTAVRWALESNLMSMGTPRPKAIVLRDWIELSLGFYDEAQIVDSKRQIAREFRAFATPDEHVCTHFYWPKDSIHATECDDWEGMLDSMAELEDSKRELFGEYSTTVADMMPKEAAWSVDFAMGSHGAWYAIDMALGDRSWHPECARKQAVQTGEILNAE